MSAPTERIIDSADLLALIRDPVFVLGPDRQILDWNPAASRALDLAPLQPGPGACHESPRLAELAAILQQVGGPFMLTLDAPDGERSYSVDMREEPDCAGGIHTIIVLLHDETPLIRLQRALAESDSRLQAILGTAMEAIITMDHEGRIVQWNPAAERIFGWRASEAIGRDLCGTLGTPQAGLAFTADGEWPPQDATFGRIRRLSAHRKDGTPVEVELSLGMFRRAGRWKALGIARDVTERALAETRLQAAEERWQFALEGGGDAVWDWNIASGEMFCGPRYLAMLGYPEDAFPHHFESLQPLVHPDDWPRVLRALNATFAQETSLYKCEYRMRSASDDYRWISSCGMLMQRDTTGAPLRMIGTHRDVHERHEAEAALHRQLAETQRLNQELEETQVQLVQSEKMASIGQLAAGVAHEMNSPLGFVKSNVGSLQAYVGSLLAMIDAYREASAGQPDTPAMAQVRALDAKIDLAYLREDIPVLFSETREGIDRAQRIVRDLKEFSHAGSEAWTYADLHQGLDSTLNILRNELKERASVIRDYASLPKLWCRPSQLNQVFLNLLANAAQSIKDRGTISVRTRVEGADIVVEIRDSGCGIPPANLKRIFDAFFTTKPVGKGTGLGLSISYGIVQKHGGRIEVDSAPGAGSSFRVVLPLRSPESASAEEDIAT